MNGFDDIDVAEQGAELDTSMVCMSVVEDGPRIAFAAYNEEHNQIIVDLCVSDGYEVQSIVERVLAAVRPTLLLVSNKIAGNTKLLEILTIPPPETELVDEADRPTGDAAVTSASSKPRSIPYRLMKSAAFDIRNCKALVLQKLRVRSLMKQVASQGGRGLYNGDGRQFLSVANGPDQQFRVSSYHALASVVDFDSTAQVQAMGSLLSFLQSTMFRMEDGGRVTVNDIVQARASMYMNLSSATLSTLHVFATEHHPLVAKGAGNAKEGASLFSLLDRTKSRAGRNRLREWMLKPLLDLDAIATRQDGVELFLLPEIQTFAGTILKLLSSVGAVDQILVRIQKCCAKPSDFIVMSRSLSAATGIIGALDEMLWNLRQPLMPDPQRMQQEQPETWGVDPQTEPYVIFLEAILKRCNTPALQELHERLLSVVNIEATGEIQHVVIQQGYNEQLDDVKEQYLHLPGESIVDYVRYWIHRLSSSTSLTLSVHPKIPWFQWDAKFRSACHTCETCSTFFSFLR